jgi:hypothetical protein
MNFLLPAFLAAGLLVGLPVALHFLRKQSTERIPFPSLRFLTPRILQESKRHRIRRWLVLLCRALAILLLVLAFGRPFFQANRPLQGTAVVVVVDDSFSMHSAERWKELKQWGEQQWDELGMVTEAGMVAARERPVWLAPMSEKVTEVRARMGAWEPGYHRARYEAALRLAGAALAASPQQDLHLIWIADHQKLSWAEVRFAEALPPGVKVHFPELPALAKRQASLHNLKASRSGAEWLVQVSSRLHTAEEDARQLTLYLQGKKIVEQPILLKRGVDQVWHFRIPLAAGSTSDSPGEKPSPLALQVGMDADDLTADDQLAIVVDPEDGIRVMLDAEASATGESARRQVDYLFHALASTQQHDDYRMQPLKISAEEWPEQALFIFRGEQGFQSPAIDRAESQLKAGGGGLILIDGNESQRAWLAQHGIVIQQLPLNTPDPLYKLQDWQMEHPILAPFSSNSLSTLLDLEFRTGWSFSPDAVMALARWSTGEIAIGEAFLNGGKVILCGFPLNRRDSDLVISSTFVPLLHQALVYLSGQARSHSAHGVGSWVPFTVDGKLERFNGEEVALVPILEGQRGFTAALPGLYRWSPASGGAPTWFGVTLDEEESDLSPWLAQESWLSLESKEPRNSQVIQQATDQSRETIEMEQKMWWWLLLAVLLFLLVEMGLSNRTAL